MKNLNLTLVASALLAATASASAEGPFSVSGNVAFATDYAFRGISQTNEEPAIQGGIDLGHESGFYLGAWGSNVEFGDATQAEFDYYGGVGGEFKNGMGWDVGAIFYDYPGEPDGSDYEFWEMYGGISHEFGGDMKPTLGLSVAYSPDYFAASDDAVYWKGTIDLSLPSDFGLGAHVGYQSIDDNDAFGTPDYTDWSIYLSKSFNGLDFAVTYYDTDLDGAECFGGPDDICDSRVVLSVGVSM